MRAVLQRVKNASVDVDGHTAGRIDKGLLVYLSVGTGDTIKDAQFIAKKLVNLRVFADDPGRMNRSVIDVAGAILIVSNFTLHGDCRKGRRPSFDKAAEPALAKQLYEKVIELVSQQGVSIEKGVFGAHMDVTSTNDGPVTFIIDS
jgi:D-tyrosyl-tRNA(Tyr) deacylase